MVQDLAMASIVHGPGLAFTVHGLASCTCLHRARSRIY